MSASKTAADAATVGSVAAAGTSWLASANEVISFIAGCIAIVAGLFAVYSHVITIQNKLKK